MRGRGRVTGSVHVVSSHVRTLRSIGKKMRLHVMSRTRPKPLATGYHGAGSAAETWVRVRVRVRLEREGET